MEPSPRACSSPAPSGACSSPAPSSACSLPAPSGACSSPGPSSACSSPAPSSACSSPAPSGAYYSPAPSILSRSCSPHLEHLSIICRPFYLPWEFTSILVSAVYIPPQADTSVALSKLHDELSGYINKHPDAACIIAGDFNKANLKKVIPNFHQPNTKPTHCLRLENQTMPPSSSHRIINNGSFKNPRWRGK